MKFSDFVKVLKGSDMDKEATVMLQSGENLSYADAEIRRDDEDTPYIYVRVPDPKAPKK